MLKLLLPTIFFAIVCPQSNEKVQEGHPDNDKPVHVALVSGCDSHLSSMTPMAYSLLHHASVNKKYRVTFVTGSQCKSVVGKLGADFFDSGFWNYPVLDPKPTRSELQRNLSMGPLIYGYPAVEAFVKLDRPDLIVAELFNVRVSLIAEQNNIPYATMWAGATPHPAMYQAGYTLNAGIAGFYSPSPDSPKWVLDFFTTLFFCQAALTWGIFQAEANIKVNEMMKERGFQKQFQDAFHHCNSYPSLALAGPPLFPLQDVPGKLTVVGMQPTEMADSSKLDEELKSFILNSPRDILYVALGTYATFKDEQFEIMKDTFLKQDWFDVIWSHSSWDEEKFGENIDKSRLLIRKKQPQKEIFSFSKTKAFLSHCGSSSMMEGVSALKVFIGCPQMRDQQLSSQVITRYNFGTVVSKAPSEEELLSALEDIHTNMEKYQANVGKVRDLAAKDSLKNLERFVDEMVQMNKTVAFDAEESLHMPFYKAAAIVSSILISILCVILSPFVGCVYLICCRRKKVSIKSKKVE